MQQFWYTIKKVKDTESYEFLLANKKCIINAEVFRKILNICLRVKGEEFTKGMFYRENVNYPELIWEDFAFQIDHRKEKKSRRETMPFPRFTKVIINHFLLQDKSLSKLKFQHYHTIKDDGIVSRLKFVRIGEDYQEYGLPIPDMMLNDKIKKSDSYQMFLKYSTGLIPPKKSIGKGSQGKKTADNKKLQILCKLSKKARKPAEDSQVLEAQVKELVGYQGFSMSPQSSLLPQVNELGQENESEHSKDSQLNSDKEEKKDNDGDADDENEDDDHIMHKDVDVEMEEAETVKRENKEKDKMTDAVKADVEKTVEEKDYVELARNAMTSDYHVKVSTKLPLPSSSLSVSSGFEISSLMDVHIQQEILRIQSPLVLKVPVLVIPEISTLPPIPKITETPVSIALSPPHVTPTISIVQQITTPIPTPPITTEAPTITTAVLKSDALSNVQLRVTKLEKDIFELKKIDHSVEALASLKSQVPMVVEHYLGSKISDDLQKVQQRHTANLIQKYSVKPTPELSKIQKPTIDLVLKSEKSASEIHKIKKEQAEKQKMPKYIIKSTDKATLKEYDMKKDEKAIDKGVADTVKNHKRQHDNDKDDDEDPSAGPNQG
ncbi:hypothetical protein Tco_0747170 [Tanacetum coccineum]